MQLWTAIIAYLCAAITRHRCGLAGSTNLTTFLQVISLHAPSKVPVPEPFGEIDAAATDADIPNQLTFTDL